MSQTTKKSLSRRSSSTNKSSDYETPPAFLPPRRPSSVQPRPGRQPHERLDMGVQTPRVSVTSPPTSRGGSRSASRASSLRSRTLSRPSSLRSIADTEYEVASAPGSQRSSSEQQIGPSSNMADRVPRISRLETIQSEGQPGGDIFPRALRRPPVLRHSSLRIESIVPEDSIVSEDSIISEDSPVLVRPRPARLSSTHSEPPRPHSHPPAKAAKVHGYNTDALLLAARHASLRRTLEAEDPYRLPPMMFDHSPLASPMLQPRPRASLTRLSSLDNFLSYQEEKAEWKRTSSVLHQKLSDAAIGGSLDGGVTTEPIEDSVPSTE